MFLYIPRWGLAVTSSLPVPDLVWMWRPPPPHGSFECSHTQCRTRLNSLSHTQPYIPGMPSSLKHFYIVWKSWKSCLRLGISVCCMAATNTLVAYMYWLHCWYANSSWHSDSVRAKHNLTTTEILYQSAAKLSQVWLFYYLCYIFSLTWLKMPLLIHLILPKSQQEQIFVCRSC